MEAMAQKLPTVQIRTKVGGHVAIGIIFLLCNFLGTPASGQELAKREVVLSVSSNPEGAWVGIRGDGLVAGSTPFSLSDLPEGVYRVEVRKEGYEPQVGMLSARKRPDGSLAVQALPLSVGKGVLRSALLPGWGQFYWGEKKRGALWTGLQAAAVAGLVFADVNYRKAVDELNSAVERYNKATDVEDIDRYRSEMWRRSDEADRAYDARLIALGLASGIWLLNVLDASFFSSNTLIASAGRGSVTFDLVPKTVKGAVLRSLAFPGWGQCYSGRKLSGVLYCTTGVISIATSIATHLNYLKKVDELKQAEKEYNEARSVEEMDRLRAEVRAKNRQADRALNYRQLSLYVLLGTWAYNVMDAALGWEGSEAFVEGSSGGIKLGLGWRF